MLTCSPRALSANRAGRLSSAQRLLVGLRAFVWTLGLLVTIGLTGGLGLALHPDWRKGPPIWGGIALLLAGAAVLLWFLGRISYRYGRDFLAGSVRTIEGLLEDGGDPDTNYKWIAGERIIAPFFSRGPTSETHCRVYVTPYGKRLLSFEPIEPPLPPP